jgi:acyl carrier protein
MRAVTPKDVQAFLQEYLDRELKANGRGTCGDLSEDCDLLLTGLIDSLGLLELVTALAEHLGREIAFDDLEPEQMTIVGPLCRFVAHQMSRE